MSDAVAARTTDVASDGAAGVRGPTALSVGVVVWLASELMFFAGLFAGWFSLRSANDVWPPEGVELAVGRTAAATVVLIVSSLTMHGAVVAVEHGDRVRSVRWLAVTALLGAVFLANLGLEYAELDFSISSHAYGSIFFLMTGFHGLHLLGGIFLMAAVAGLISGRTEAPAAPAVEVCSYYWHFVDVVWVAMFATIYLLG
ncbi:cytochrome c oxidase subunit 3 [Actinospongicola halichondriae]|uniref:cytochrome c oxidase subunit 3 n=1 Tax=Actinospongicola halichondriae TaxID=3236844 RepID=UPI003D4385B4